jgi:hypothetical protein
MLVSATQRAAEPKPMSLSVSFLNQFCGLLSLLQVLPPRTGVHYCRFCYAELWFGFASLLLKPTSAELDAGCLAGLGPVSHTPHSVPSGVVRTGLELHARAGICSSRCPDSHGSPGVGPGHAAVLMFLPNLAICCWQDGGLFSCCLEVPWFTWRYCL